MSKQIDPEQDYDDFEEWFQDLPEDQYGRYSFAWQEAMQKGHVIERSGYGDFQDWVYDNRWPEVRMAREMDRLTQLSETARWAA